MNAAIVSVGAEFLTGRCVDTNAVWLSEQLTQSGVQVVRHITVGDDADQIQKGISEAFVKSDLVVVTGGLGPTPDDVTRYAIADVI